MRCPDGLRGPLYALALTLGVAALWAYAWLRAAGEQAAPRWYPAADPELFHRVLEKHAAAEARSDLPQ